MKKAGRNILFLTIVFSLLIAGWGQAAHSNSSGAVPDTVHQNKQVLNAQYLIGAPVNLAVGTGVSIFSTAASILGAYGNDNAQPYSNRLFLGLYGFSQIVATNTAVWLTLYCFGTNPNYLHSSIGAGIGTIAGVGLYYLFARTLYPGPSIFGFGLSGTALVGMPVVGSLIGGSCNPARDTGAAREFFIAYQPSFLGSTPGLIGWSVACNYAVSPKQRLSVYFPLIGDFAYARWPQITRFSFFWEELLYEQDLLKISNCDLGFGIGFGYGRYTAVDEFPDHHFWSEYPLLVSPELSLRFPRRFPLAVRLLVPYRPRAFPV